VVLQEELPARAEVQHKLVQVVEIAVATVHSQAGPVEHLQSKEVSEVDPVQVLRSMELGAEKPKTTYYLRPPLHCLQ
jgi:hypothetical protein